MVRPGHSRRPRAFSTPAEIQDAFGGIPGDSIRQRPEDALPIFHYEHPESGYDRASWKDVTRHFLGSGHDALFNEQLCSNNASLYLGEHCIARILEENVIHMEYTPGMYNDVPVLMHLAARIMDTTYTIKFGMRVFPTK